MMTTIEKLYKIDQYTVTPIRVIRRGILPGCKTETITAVDENGNKFQGDPKNFFTTSSKAWRRVNYNLLTDIVSAEFQIERFEDEVKKLKNVLKNLPQDGI